MAQQPRTQLWQRASAFWRTRSQYSVPVFNSRRPRHPTPWQVALCNEVSASRPIDSQKFRLQPVECLQFIHQFSPHTMATAMSHTSSTCFLQPQTCRTHQARPAAFTSRPAVAQLAHRPLHSNLRVHRMSVGPCRAQETDAPEGERTLRHRTRLPHGMIRLPHHHRIVSMA